MCKAIQDIRLEGLMEGRMEGIEQGTERTILMTISILRSLGMTDEEIVEKIVENSSISEENAERYVYGEE